MSKKEDILQDGGQALVKSLENQGIEYVFGLSGGAALPIFDALVATNNEMKFVLVRHEQGGTHMADGYARATGKPAVVLVTSGPGATNTLTGIMTAHMDSVPMLVVTGQQITVITTTNKTKRIITTCQTTGLLRDGERWELVNDP